MNVSYVIAATLLLTGSCGKQLTPTDKRFTIEKVAPTNEEDAAIVAEFEKNGGIEARQQEGMNLVLGNPYRFRGTLDYAFPYAHTSLGSIYFARYRTLQLETAVANSLVHPYGWTTICTGTVCGPAASVPENFFGNLGNWYNRPFNVTAYNPYNYSLPFFAHTGLLGLFQPIPVGRWYQVDRAFCPTFCAGIGLANIQSPDGALCASGEAIAPSTLGVIAQQRCWPSCAAHNFVGAASVGGFCYTPGQKRDNDRSDRTTGCFCGTTAVAY
jgi:hypothetical protein